MTEQSNTTRDSILQAALELFAEKGYHETSMAAVAEKAGVGKGTLYWYFGSKDEMFKTVITEKGVLLFGEIERILQELAEEKLTPEQGLKEFIRVKMTFMVENRELSQIILNNMQYTDEDFKLKLLEEHKRLIRYVQEIIEHGILTGVFRDGLVREMAVAIIGITNSIGSVLFFENSTDAEGMTNFIDELILNGIKNCDN